MIPGVTTQAPGKRFQALQIIAMSSPTAVTVGRSRSYPRAIALLTGQAITPGRSKALPKAIGPHIGQVITTTRLKTKVLLPLIGSALNVATRSVFGKVVSFAQAQLIPSPYITPASIFGTNLVAWYKADTAVYNDAGTTLATNGQTVQQWNDQSGHGYNLSQATSANRPTLNTAGYNSKPAVVFSSSSATLLATGASAVSLGGTTAAGFAVGQQITGIGGNARLLDFIATGDSSDTGTAKSGIFIIRASTPSVYTYRGGVGFGSGVGVLVATNYRMGGVFDGTNQVTYINNVAGTASAGAGTWGSTGQIRVGNDPTGGAWNGPCAEIVVVKVAPTVTQLAQLDAYFTTKWGV